MSRPAPHPHDTTRPTVHLTPLDVSASNSQSASSKEPSPVSPHWKAIKLDVLKRTAVNAFVEAAAPAQRSTTPGPLSRFIHRAPKPAPAVHQRSDAELFKQELLAIKLPQFAGRSNDSTRDRKGKARAVASVSSLRDVALDGRDQLRELVRLAGLEIARSLIADASRLLS